MLSQPISMPTPLMNKDNDEMAFYASELEAGTAAKSSFLGEHYGYEIFQLGQDRS